MKAIPTIFITRHTLVMNVDVADIASGRRSAEMEQKTADGQRRYHRRIATRPLLLATENKIEKTNKS